MTDNFVKCLILNLGASVWWLFKLFTLLYVHYQAVYLIPANGCWHSLAGKITTDRALHWFIHLLAQILRKGYEHITYIPVKRARKPLPFTRWLYLSRFVLLVRFCSVHSCLTGICCWLLLLASCLAFKLHIKPCSTLCWHITEICIISVFCCNKINKTWTTAHNSWNISLNVGTSSAFLSRYLPVCRTSTFFML